MSQSIATDPIAPPALTAPAPHQTTGSRTEQKKRRRQRILIFVLLGIPTGYMAFFLGIPVVKAIYLSFTNLGLTGPTAAHSSFTGLENYRTMFTSNAFWQGLKASAEYLVGSAIIGQVAVGFLMAVFIERLGRVARSILMSLMVIAWIIPEIVVAFIWSGFLSTPKGLANILLGFVGVAPVSFLYGHAMLSLVVANAWRGMAFSVLVLGAALQAVPTELIESAKLDGAGEWGLIRYVRLPLIRTAVATVLALTTLFTLADFTLIFVLTGGGPNNQTNVLPVYTYQTSFSFYELGYGTAVSLVLLLLACGLAYFYVRVGARDLKGAK
jgi:multiple sugar transport system permease protein